MHFLKAIKEENSNDYSYVKKDQKYMIDPYTKGSLEVIKQHLYSPALTPSISKKNHRSNNSQKRPMSKKMFISNNSKYLNSQNLFGSQDKKYLKSEKTEANLINENLDQIKNKINNLNRIKTITNIYHINQKNLNKILDNINKIPLINNDYAKIYDSNNNIINNNLNNNNMNNLQNPLFRAKKNKVNNGSSQIISNVGELIINPKIIGFKKLNIYDKNEKDKNGIRKKIIIPISSISYTNKNIKNQLSSNGKIIMNNNNIFGGIIQNKKMNNQKYFDNIHQENNKLGKEVNTNKKSYHKGKEDIILLNKEKNSINSPELEEIDNNIFYLRNLRNNKAIFLHFLKLIEAHMIIELLLNRINNLIKINTGNYEDEFFDELNNLLIIYFTRLHLIYDYYNNKNSNTIIQNNNEYKAVHLDNFFLYQSLNDIFHKTIKIQICFFSLIFLILSLKLENYKTIIKNNFYQIIKDISNPLFSIFKNFIQEEINFKYPEIINYLMYDFNENFNKLHKIQKFTQTLKPNEIIILIQKQLDKSINSLKYYSNLKLKNSFLKIFDEVLNDLLLSLETKTLNQFIDIILNSILFGELYRKIKINNSKSSNLRKDVSNIQMGSSIVNRVNDFPPFLPSINPKYKYTLVLEFESILINTFNTNFGRAFFIRPYCFEFLEELNDLYEIIIFTSDDKESADNILNKVDKDNKIIKYRLYRHHCSSIGIFSYKELNLIGRDLSKVIILDNSNKTFQPYNNIYIKYWSNDINDLELKDLLKLLKDIVTLKVNDVRPVIKKIKNEIKIGENNIKRLYKNINVEKLIGIDKNEVLIPKQEVEIPNNDLVKKNNMEEHKDNNSNVVNSENSNNQKY